MKGVDYMDIGDIKVFDLVMDDTPDIGDKIRDQKKRTWEIIELISFGKYKCKFIKLEE